MSVTFEEAQRCPKCSTPGEVQNDEVRPGPNGSKLHVIRCMNERCSWYDTDWIVQLDPDGTVPVRDTAQPKSFPPFTGMTTEKAREQAALDDLRNRGG